MPSGMVGIAAVTRPPFDAVGGIRPGGKLQRFSPDGRIVGQPSGGRDRQEQGKLQQRPLPFPVSQKMAWVDAAAPRRDNQNQGRGGGEQYGGKPAVVAGLHQAQQAPAATLKRTS